MLRSITVVALLGLITSQAAFAQQPEPCRETVTDKCRVAVPKTVPKQPHKTPTYDMGVLDVAAKNRKIMLMTFLERAREELERATLDRRSFMPELIKTVDAETL